MGASGLHLIEVRDLRDPRLEVYRNQTDAWLRARHNPDRLDDAPDALTRAGLFMAEGILVVEQLLLSDYEVHSVLVSRSRLERVEGLLARLEPSVPIFVCEARAMDELVGFHIHRGLLACARRRAPASVASLLGSCERLLVMEDLANHDNVGGIFRSLRALWGEQGGVLLNDRTCDPLYRKALRVSMGHVLHVPFAETDTWHTRGMEQVRHAGFTTIALTPAPDAMDLRDLDPAQIPRPALIVGAEGPGLRASTIERADLRVRIPMRAGVDSLNVTVAASLAMHHLTLAG